MKDDLAFKQSKRLGHTRQHFDIFNSLANWAVDEAGGTKKVFGEKPEVAGYTPTDLGTEAGKAVKSNIANAPDIQALLEKILPGYGEIVKTGGKNALSMLRGEIPEDVQHSIQRTAAFKSLQGGYGGSGMSRALVARDIGKTSLDLSESGGNAAQRWLAATQGSVSPYVVTAPAQAAQTERNNLYDQAVKQFGFNVAAAPDPGAAGIFNLQTALGAMAASYGTSSALGGQKAGGASSVGGGNSGGGRGGGDAGAYPYNWWGGG